MLKGKNARQVSALGGAEGCAPRLVQLTRLAMLYNNENPADDVAVEKWVRGPGKAFAAFVKPILDMEQEGPIPEFDEEGGAKVGAYTIKPISAQDLFDMRPLNNTADIIGRVAGLTKKKVDDMPYSDYSALEKAIDFLAEDLSAALI